MARTIHQFEITMEPTEPPIWRRIQLSGNATFRDLHCAINDAMGWEDEHLHAFEVGDKRHPVTIGMRDDDSPRGMAEEHADWDVAIADHFKQRAASAPTCTTSATTGATRCT